MYKSSTKKTTKKRNPTHWWSYEVGFIYQKFSRKQEYSYIWKKSEKYTFSVKFLLGGIKASVWDLKTSTRMKIQITENWVLGSKQVKEVYDAAARLAEIIPLQGGRGGSGQETRRGYSTDHSRARGRVPPAHLGPVRDDRGVLVLTGKEVKK